MSLYIYQGFEAERTPDPSEPLSVSISPAAIKEANDAVKSVGKSKSEKRGSYAKFTLDQQAEIGKYALMHGNQAAIRHFLITEWPWPTRVLILCGARVVWYHDHTKIKNAKIYSNGFRPFIRKFAPTKISRYTVKA